MAACQAAPHDIIYRLALVMSKFSSTLMDHFQAPRNSGKLDNPSSVGTSGSPGSGPYMVFHLQTNQDVVVDIKYQTYGCGAAIAAGSVLTTLVKNRPIDDCLAITSDQLIQAMDGIPDDKIHCASLAIEALHDGLRNITQ
ncbi:iron-sulfur cluster assembly scaffold protein [bacterium]|nr:iron-sulfur cluster assembly scaffold protein [bacterium]